MRARRDHDLVRLPLLILIAAPFSPRLSRHMSASSVEREARLLVAGCVFLTPLHSQLAKGRWCERDLSHFSHLSHH